MDPIILHYLMGLKLQPLVLYMQRHARRAVKVSIYRLRAARFKLTANFGGKSHSPSCCLLSWRRRRGLLRGVTSDAELRTYGATKRREGVGQLHNVYTIKHFRKLHKSLDSSKMHITRYGEKRYPG